MTNEQALDVLRRAIDPLQDAVDNVALYMAFDALEKQIPMKPQHTNKLIYKCPRCGSIFLFNTEEYCIYCGQAIDWRE